MTTVREPCGMSTYCLVLSPFESSEARDTISPSMIGKVVKESVTHVVP